MSSSGPIGFNSGHPGNPKTPLAAKLRVFAGYCRELATLDYRAFTPAFRVLAGYLLYIVAGCVLLCLPISQKAASVPALDNLFIAASAVSTTGLCTTSISDRYTFFGQLIVLLLIQLGGIGFMTASSFIVLARKRELPASRQEISRTVYSLPASFRIDKFIRSVILFTLSIEGTGALILYFVLRDAGEPNALWSAIFHSVSAFCTAGFGLYNNSFESYAGNFWLNMTIAVLSYLGAMGFIVCVDYWRKWKGQTKQITLTSRIIVWATLLMTVGGTALLFVAEDSLRAMPPDRRLLAAFFQCMTAMTTVGFNTVPISALSHVSILLIIVLMVIGASPSGTGGGLKTTTVSALWGVMRSAMRGESEARFWGKPIPHERIWMAFATLGFYLAALLAGTYLLNLCEATPFDQNFFEAASALGTVGLSMGITSGLTVMGKAIIVLMMFCGRVGPLTMGTALFCRPNEKAEMQDSDLAI